MRKYSFLSAIIFPVFLLLFSCEKQQQEPTVFRVSESIVSMPLEGASKDITVTCDFSWSCSVKNGSWLKASSSVTDGSNGILSLSAPFNDSAESRSDTVIVTSGSSVKKIAVVQNGLNSLLSQTSVTITDKGKVAFVLEALDDWTAEPVTTRASASWFEISPSSGKKGSSIVSVIPTEKNLNIGDRTGYAKICMGGHNLYVTVTQKQTDAILLTSDKVELPNTESSFSIEVKSNVSCTAAIGTECSSWLSVEGTRALDSKTVVFHALANDSENVRKGTITFSGSGISETVEVWQAEKDILILEDGSIEIGSEGGASGVDVRTNVEYSVEILQDPDWIKLVTTRSQRVDRIEFSVEPNNDFSSRTAVIRVKDLNSSLSQDLVVVQKQKDAILLNSDAVTVSNKGEEFTVRVDSNVDYGISIISGGDWLRTLRTRALAAHDETFAADANPSVEPREARIVFSCGMLSDTLLIRQGGKDFIELSRNGAEIKFFGGRTNVSVRSNVEYETTWNDASDWIEEIQPSIDVSGVYDFYIHPNRTNEMREGHIVFKDVCSDLSETLTILQYARPENTFLDYDIPGAYGFNGTDWTYCAGSSQKWIIRGERSYSFRIVWPSSASVLEIDGLEYVCPDPGEWVNVKVGLFSRSGSVSADCRAQIVQVEDGLCWMQSDGYGDFIVKLVSR